MAMVFPAPFRAEITRTAGGIEIRVPPARSAFMAVLSSAFVGVPGFILFAALTDDGHAPPGLEWFPMPLLVGGVGIYLWLYNLFGEFRMVIDAGHLQVRRSIAGIGNAKTYNLVDVRNLRLKTWGRKNPQTGLAFDYGGSTVCFGAEIEEPELARALEEILAAFPALKLSVPWETTA